MEPTQIILIIAAIILSMMALKFVTKLLFRLIIVLITIITFYMAYQHFSGTNIIDEITKICNPNNSEPIKCACFVQPILTDLNDRFNTEEIESLKKNKLKSNIEFGRSFKTKESEIKNCFETLGETTILEELLNDINLKDFFYSND